MSQLFGKYEVRHGNILDHDTYAFLRVMLYPKKENPRISDLMLNGEIIGQIIYERNYYYPLKFIKEKEKFLHVKDGRDKAKYNTLGKAAASIISEFVR